MVNVVSLFGLTSVVTEQVRLVNVNPEGGALSVTLREPPDAPGVRLLNVLLGFPVPPEVVMLKFDIPVPVVVKSNVPSPPTVFFTITMLPGMTTVAAAI